jgi:aspartate racemase
MGGSVALEMAQQLHAQGEQVALLALFDTYNYSKVGYLSLPAKTAAFIEKVRFHWLNFLILPSKNKWTFIREKVKIARGRTNVWFGMVTSRLGRKFHLGNRECWTLFDLWEINDRAVVEYEPKVYPGRITVFLPHKEYSCHLRPEVRWDNMAMGGLETCRLPVYPAGMLVEPFVEVLAEKLKGYIDKVLESVSNHRDGGDEVVLTAFQHRGAVAAEFASGESPL